jgi:hypothetical protein
MEMAVQDATVEGYEKLLPALHHFGEDAHVVAAAVHGHADVIVTSNLKDFPDRLLDVHGVAAQSPDDFLVQRWWLDPVAVAAVLVEQARGTSRPALSPQDILTRLRFPVPTFARMVQDSEELRRVVESTS